MHLHKKIQRAAINQTLSIAEGLRLENSLITGTKREIPLEKFHRFQYELSDVADKKPKLSKKYFLNSKKFYRNKLNT